MPILSYFLVVGSVLTGLLLWLGNEIEPVGAALPSSSTAGIPVFKPEPEAEHARVTTVNFAAEHEPPERKLVKTAEAPARRKAVRSYSRPEPLSQFAEYPHHNLNIH